MHTMHTANFEHDDEPQHSVGGGIIGGTFPSSFGDGVVYESDENHLHAVFDVDITALQQHLVAPALTASWAVLLAKSFETRDIVFDFLSSSPLTQFNISIDVAWSVGDLISTTKDHLASSDIENVVPSKPSTTSSLIPSTFIVSEEQYDADIKDRRVSSDSPCVARCTVNAELAVNIKISFERRIVEEKLARRLCSRFALICKQILLGSQKQSVASLDVFSREDWDQLMQINGTCPPTVNETVHTLVARQVAERPNAPAIKSWDGALTYRELDGYSSRLATVLAKKLQPGAENIVPICFEKSKWPIVAMLAVMKAGAAYVPLDPAYPETRINNILDAVNARIVLASDTQGGNFESPSRSLDVVVIDDSFFDPCQDVAESSADHAVFPSVNPASPAAILFTSGSTGKPKGVTLTHSNLATGISYQGPKLGLGPHTKSLQFATLTFDASIMEIFSTLIFGGCVCVITEDERLDDLEGAINKFECNFSFLTTTVAGLLDPEDVPTLHTLVVGGEPVTQDVVSAWSPRNLIMIYGPSETTIFCLAHFGVKEGTNPASLGRPVGCQTFLVDPDNHNCLAPIGTRGEIVVAGGTIGRGYLNDRDKTAAAWIDQPKWRAGGFKLSAADEVPRRIYKTGDIAIVGGNGDTYYCARKDTQTKLRGQRMELGEIEYHLTKHSEVLQAAVFHPKSGPAKHKIVAVLRFANSPNAPSSSTSDSGSGSDESLDDSSFAPIIPEQGSDMFWLTVEGLEDHLEKLLPQYMVPNVWLGIRQLPQTMSGKVDRVGLHGWLEELPVTLYHKLVRADNIPPVSQTAHAQSSDQPIDLQLQLQLREIWSNVLNFPAEKIPFDASFFQLGGDSITAMQVASRCVQAGIPVSVQQLLLSRTIARLAETVRAAASTNLTRRQSVILDSVEIGKPFPLTPMQRFMFSLQPDGQNHHNQGFLVRLTRDIAPDAIVKCIEAIAHAHPMLRARYRKVNGTWAQVITDDVKSSYTMQTCEAADLHDVDRIIALRQKVFDVEQGPIFSVDLFSLPEKGEKILFLNAHHLIIDLVSWRIVLQDLEDMLMKGSNVSLPRSTSFQKWAKLQIEHTKTLNVADTIPFTLPDISTSPRDYWGLNVQNRWGDNKETSFSLSPQLTEQLLRDANKPLGTAPMDIILAAMSSAFLSIFVDRPSLVVHCEGHGREPWDMSIDVSRTVGWFTTIYPVLLSRENDPLELLIETKANREQVLDHGRPYFASWQYSEEQALLTSNQDYVSPIEILFNYQGAYQQLHKENGVFQRVTELDVENSMNSPDLHRYALFEIEAAIEGDRFVVYCIYNGRIQREAEVLEWVSAWEEHLTSMLNKLSSLETNQAMRDYPNPRVGSLPRMDSPNPEEIPHSDRSLFMSSGINTDKKLAPFSLLGGHNIGAKTKEILSGKYGYAPEMIEDAYPCAPLQEALIALSIMHPGSYTTQHVYEVPKNLDVERFKNAWQATVNAHAVLRTQFVLGTGSKMVQVVLRQQELDWAVDPPADRKKLLFEYHQPLCRYELFNPGTDRAKFIWTIHHTLADGWAFELITADVATAYCHGEGVIMKTPRTSYSSFIRYLQGLRTEESLDFWKAKLEGYMRSDFPPVIDGPQKASPETTKIVHTVGLDVGGTEFTSATILSATWALLMSRLANTSDVCFGAPVTGRMIPLAGVESMVGPTIQTLPTRLNVDSSMSVLEFLGEVEKSYIETIPHEHVGLQNISRLSEAAKAACAFRTMLVVQPQPAKEMEIDGVPLMHKLEALLDVDYPLALSCWQNNDSVKLELSYDASQMDGSLAARTLAQFECLLSEFAQSLRKHSIQPPTLRDLSSFSEEDGKLLRQWNAHDAPAAAHGGPETTVPEVMERNARLRPQASAIVGWNGSVTYSELSMLSNRLATYLVGQGVGYGTMIPVVFERSIWFVVAVMGAWKAGAAFVPVDPTQPLDRLSQIIETVSQRAIVALSSVDQEAFTRKLTGLNTIPVDRNSILSLQMSNARTSALPTPKADTDSYVIFTSGSTGKPKGVVVQHGALFASFVAQARDFALDNTERVLAFCSYIWDVHLLENFLPLFSGGTVCVPSEHERTDRLTETLNAYKVTRAHLSPTVASLLDGTKLPYLNILAVGGESMSTKTVRALSPHMRLCNCYGPTEASITSNMFVDIQPNTSPKNIGRATGSQCWIVDIEDHQRLLPVGSVGELALAGPPLARGYLDREPETKAAFVSDLNWGPEFGVERIYKTGDIAKFNPDGTVEYLGRKDAQVKINGIRIELGEIESNIISVCGRECAVETTQTSAKSNSRVLAAFVSWNDAAGNFEEAKKNLDEEMRSRLPRYMVPTLWVPLPRLPQQQSTGKVDRKALRSFFNGLTKRDITKFSVAEDAEERVITPPIGNVEKNLQTLWATILELAPEEIGRDDHFFRMQGDSVGAIRLVSEARRMGFHITSKDIFQHPVLHEMAANMAFIESDLEENDVIAPFSLVDQILVPELIKDAAQQIEIESDDQIEDILPCGPMQEGLIASSFSERGSYIVNHMSQLPADMDMERFMDSWQKVIAHTPILRTRIIQSPVANDDFLQVVLKHTPVPWDTPSPEDLDNYLAEVANIKVTSGSVLLRLGLCGDKFIFTIHHALYDAGSLPHVFEHFQQAYRGEELTARTPYRSFLRYVGQLDKEESAALWRRELDGATGTQFPASETNKIGERPPQAEFFTRHVEVEEHHSDYTISTVLRAAWGLVLTRHTKKEDICFRETFSGKNAPVVGVDNMGGPTICTLPFRVQIDEDTTVGAYLDSVHGYATRIIGHEHFGVQNIARLSADAQAACQFGTLLVIQPTEDSEESLGFGIKKIASPMNQNIPLILEFTLKANGGLKLTARYDQVILSEAKVSLILGHIENVLNLLLTSENNTPVSEISLFGKHDEEWLQTLDNPTPPPGEKSIWDLIEEHAAEDPNAEAVCSWDGSFTYAEFVFSVTALASFFVDNGIGADAPIGLCFYKSKWVIVFMLAALKAGSSYVSLDPKSPAARASLILESCKPKVIFTVPEAHGIFSGLPYRVHPVNFADMPGFLRMLLPKEMQESRIKLNQVAYIIYTSGSTGTPKGVVISNGALVDTALALANYSDFTRKTRTFQFSALTWDAAVYEVYSALAVGGCVCLPSEDERVGDLTGAIDRMRANADLLMPSVAGLIEPEEAPTLQTLLLGGEAVNRNDVTRWVAAGRDVRICYGPTEACVVALMNNEVKGTGLRGNPANLGTPVPGQCSAWIVDRQTGTRLAGVGEIGELVLSGHNLSLGYLNDKAKTDAAFFNGAWLEGRSTTRCYRTGDLAQYESDGSILFCGRKDNQIKLRGLRIEIGEIEYHLLQDPLLNRGVVIFPNEGRYQKSIVAVFSLASAETKDGAASEEDGKTIRDDVAAEIEIMKTNLSSKVPSYMVPTTWLALRAVPVTPIGKIDRRQIVGWVEGLQKEDTKNEKEAPVANGNDPFANDSPVRQLLRKIWADVLDIPAHKIAADASFFRLGGDSISAIRLVSRCRRENLNVTSKQIKRLKTIEQLETVVTPISASKALSTAVASQDPFDLSPIQKFHYQLAPAGCPSFSQATLLRVSQKLTEQKLSQALQHLVQHHDMLQARFIQKDGSWMQLISGNVGKAYRITHHKGQNLESMRSIAAAAQQNFDLENGHTMNVCLFDTEEGQQYVYLIAHHLVVDFVSWKIIITDLESLVLSDCKEALIPSQLTYNDWVKKVKEHAKTVPAAPEPDVEAVEFWGFTPSSTLTYGSRVEVAFNLSTAATANMMDYALANDTEVLTILIASLAASFWRVFPDREQLGLFLENHGRDTWESDIDLSRTVGWFTTFYPLFTSRSFAKKSKDIVSLVQHFKAAREQVTDAQAYLAARTSQSTHSAVPLEVVFNYFGSTDAALKADNGLFELEDSVDFTVIPGEMARVGMFEITTALSNGRLNASFTYDVTADHQERIKAWASSWEKTLTDLGTSGPAVARRASLRTTGPPKVILNKINSANAISKRYPLLPRTNADLDVLLNNALPSIGINPADVADIYPCSPMQVGIAISQIKEPEAYNIHIKWEVTSSRGKVDTARLANAWEQTIRRHAMLRTVFVEDPSGSDPLLQVVLAPSAKMPFPKAGRAPRVLGGQLPYRLDIAEPEAPGKPAMIHFECSHAIYDSWSNGVLLRDLSAAYEDKLTLTLAPGFGLFISHLQSLDAGAGKDFWTNYLRDAEICHFPSLANEKNPTDESASLAWQIPDFDLINQFCASHDTTAAVFFKFVWSLVLRLYTNNDVVAFGSLVDGRDPDFDGVEDIVGPVINTLICKASLAGDKTAADALRELQEAAEDSMEHQRCSLSQVESWAGFSGVHMFNTVMSFYIESVHSGSLDPSGELNFNHISASDNAEYPVLLKVMKRSDSFNVQVDYRTAHISSTHAENLRDMMKTMVARFVRNPAITVEELQRADLAQSADVCVIVNPTSEARFLPKGCFGDLMIKTPFQKYRTGQVARYSIDGTVNDVRPSDALLKVRGYMVDLAAIEAAFFDARQEVYACEAASQFIVAPMPKTQIQARLVVYVCFDKFAPFSTSSIALSHALRTAVKPRLPAHYQHLVIFERFVPVSGCSEAVNRQSLLGLVTEQQLSHKTIFTPSETSEEDREEEIEPSHPMAEMETAMQALFSKVLSVAPEKITKTSNFFEMGGDSLSAMQLVQVAKRQGFRITHANILRSPVLENMALHLTKLSPDVTNPASTQQQAKEEERTTEPEANTVPAPFSLITKTTSMDKIARAVPHGIEDAYPANFFQRWSIPQAMGPTRNTLSHFVFDIESAHLDIPRLKKACRVFVQRNEIMRTAFWKDSTTGETLQLLLNESSFTPDFTFESHVADIETATTSYIESHGALKTWGEPIVRFHALSAGNSHRLLMRIAHAQFDGLSMFGLMEELRYAYANPAANLTESRRPKISSFVQACTQLSADPAGKRFWSNLLHGTAGFTDVVSGIPTAPRKNDASYRSANVTNDSYRNLNSTFSNALKTAWAAVLATHAQTHDVVFGNLVSARTAPMSDAERVVNCCINVVPVRAHLTPGASARQVLESVQEQHAHSMPLEAMDYDTICAAAGWAQGTRLTSVVQHQNMKEVGDAIPMADGESWRFHQRQPVANDFDIWVISWTKEEGRTEVGVGYDANCVPKEVADGMVRGLVEVLEGMAREPERELASFLQRSGTAVGRKAY